MNKDLLIKGCIFLAGGIVGIGTGLYLAKRKYEQVIIDKTEEIEFLRDRYSVSKSVTEIRENIVDALQEGTEVTEQLTVQDIRNKVQELGYINEMVMEENKKKEEEDDMNGPMVIAPEETWERDYPTITLTYYEGDKILTDENDRIIKNVDELVGKDFASHFGEYEDDVVYVKNERLAIYYEIIRDYASYSEVFK